MKIADYPQKAAEYCMKKETRVKGPYEIGDPSGLGQGSRTDLKEVALAVQEKGLRGAVMERPDMFIKYHRGMERLAQYLQKPRNTKPKITYIFGPTESGKTFYAKRKLGCGDDYYLKDPRNKWWDFLEPGQGVIIDEMRGWLNNDKSYTLMCLDGYNMLVETKGGFARLNTGDIWITSNRSPRWIGRKNRRGCKEFLRRLDKVIYHDDRRVQIVCFRMATDKTQGLPHVAAATAAEIAAAAIAPFVQKRLASLLRSRDACEAELKIVSGVPGFEARVKYLTKRVQDLNSQIFPLVNK